MINLSMINSLLSTQFPAFAINLNKEIIWWNRASEELTGIKESEILWTNQYWNVFFETPTTLPADLLLCSVSLTEEQIESLNFYDDMCFGIIHIQKKLNGKSLLWINASRLFDDDKKLMGAVMLFQPISLRHLAWHSPLLEELITRFPAPIAIVLNGRITLTNQLYADLTGYNSPGEMINLPVDTFIDKRDLKRFHELNQNNHAGLMTGENYHWRYRVKGKLRYVMGSPTLFRWGRDTALISIITDETEQVEREQQLMKEKAELSSANEFLLKKLREKDGYFISNSTIMRNVMDKALQLAKSEINVALLGETGTGKTLLAKMIHDAGPRKDKPFVTVNCAAIPENLIESAFFGHVKGAFTGAFTSSQGFLATANEGTLFLDEVAELSPALQAKLLHAIETKHFTPLGSSKQQSCNIRIISATHRNLAQMLQNGTLREDFFYRIFVVDLYLPPLRERREDIPLLIDFFLKRFSGTDTPPAIPEKILMQMTNAPWAGNIRELQNVILRFIATGEIANFTGAENKTIKINLGKCENLLDIEQCKAEAEKRCLNHALSLAKGCKGYAAQLLNMNPRTFRRYCSKYKIKVE